MDVCVCVCVEGGIEVVSWFGKLFTPVNGSKKCTVKTVLTIPLKRDWPLFGGKNESFL